MIASDFTDNSLTGITTVIGGFASITKTLTNDISLEGLETFQVNIRTGDPSGPIVGTSPIIVVADSSVPTYEVVPSTLSINEEQSVTFTINTAGVPDNTTLYYSISGSSGLVAADFLDDALTGSFVINSNTGTITKTLSLDFTTEGNETFTLSVRRGSPTGTIVATTPTITIVDTSISPYEFTSFTFTNAGATGRTGPTLTQCLSSYNTTTYPWLTNTSFFNMVSQGKQLWTVKIGGVYEFDVRGARGGTYSNGGTTYVGAHGARIVSRVTLSVGQVIAIAVGQKGQDSASYPTSGGGSFVVLDSTSTPLVVAGGGAAAGSGGGGNLLSNAQGQITTFGGSPGSRGGGSGTNGGGGGGGRNTSGGNAADGSNGSYSQASGGAGFYGSGGEASGATNSRGLKWSLGMTGGYSSTGDATLVGGFGGGAGCAPAVSAGGAGGYSGGGGAYYNYLGQGGGSFTTSSFSGTNITATQGYNSDHGSVSVTLISITESYNTRPLTQNANEGTIVTFRTDTVGVANTTLYYTISGSSGLVAADFTDNALTGSFNVVSGVGITTKTLSNDLSISEGTESFYMDVRTGSTSGPIVATSPTVYVYDTSTATFNVTPSVGFLNEGSSVGFAVTTTNIPDNTTLYYSISGSAGISTSDFTDGALTGSFNIISNGATVTKTISNDLSSNEGIETFNMRILVGSTGGQITTTSSNVTIYDTSISPYVVTPSTLSVNEGSSVIFTTTTTAIPDTTLYYNISGSAGISASDFTSNSLTGSFPLVSGVGSTTLTLSNDLTTEGTETFYMNIRTGSTSGSIVGVSSSVTITDTSINPALYSFNSFTFTNGTATGATGPTSFAAVSSYTSQPWYASYFSVSSGIQFWTAPETGNYRIRAAGAAGNSGNMPNACRGIIIDSIISLVKNQQYKIVVGQMGIQWSGTQGSGGGGGGTFMIDTSNTAIIIAGGGGGWESGTNAGSFAYTDGQSTTNGSDGSVGGSSAVGGTPGNGGGSGYYTGGGGGYLTNGGNALQGSSYGFQGGGFAFINGANGGNTATTAFGGFGGGGGTHGNNGGGGGGGGYSGGGGGGYFGNTGGGGGGSYSSSSLTVIGYNTGHGYLTISNLNPQAPNIVTTGLVLNLDAGNTSSYPGSGTTWTDLIGGNNGTLTNGPTYSGANGGSIVFDGTNDYVNIGVGKGVNQFSGDFAISVWVMTDSTGSTFGNIIGDYYTNSVNTTNEWQLMISNGAQISFYRAGTGSIFNIASGYSANSWINVAVTRIGSTISLYTNSNLIATATNSQIFGTATGNLNIGIDGNNTSEPFKGKIATVQIYKDKGLSASEVLQNYNVLRGRYGI